MPQFPAEQWVEVLFIYKITYIRFAFVASKKDQGQFLPLSFRMEYVAESHFPPR